MIAKKFSLKLISSKDIFDIVLFGSASKSDRYNDIDVAIILKVKKTLKEKLEISQQLRNLNPDHELDVKVIEIDDLLDQNFIARQAILAEGISFQDNRYLHEKFGFKTYAYFNYDISKLTYSKKKTLYYALNGRTTKGLFKEKNAVSISNTLIKVPLMHSSEFKDFFKLHGCEFKTWVSLEYDSD
jgi:predicted nucleotidyltransferase